jgi:phenylacetate-CoA ligase
VTPRMLFAILSRLRALRRRERWERARLLAFQAEALSQTRANAYAHSPFYQRFHQGLHDAPLDALPVLTKAALMEQFDALVTDRDVRLADVEAHLNGPGAASLFRGRYWATATSGSSGRRGIFLFSRDEWAAVMASFARAREWAGLRIALTRQVKTAVVASTTAWHMSSLVAATGRSWWMPELRLAASEPLESIVARLNAWQPELLISYASMGHLLAEEQRAGRLRISPRRVMTSSEVLTDTARRAITAAWGEVLFNQYAATETGAIAAECPGHHGLHLFEDHVLVEVVDADNRPVPPGTFGAKLLVTTLFSRTLPLIRYELGDSVCLSGALCPEGRPFATVTAIEGRTEDVLALPGEGGGVVRVHPLVFHRVMDRIRASGWQVVQEPGGLRVLLAGAPEEQDAAAVGGAIQRALAEQQVAALPVRVEQVVAIPKAASGKAPLIKALHRETAPEGMARSSSTGSSSP